ncbi:hypothetical protein [Chromobacterium violaceum]|uniref:hypothetical protein n=1 Tax=Chromobacterium violaceum TaxID=536 RepID=UPI00194F811C|nr:hypothetical protein [Chromobacterium violaceum]QRO33954.1 hypothetical protein I6K04_04215 [Chromobacterium violaceum]QRQ16242.1 hypothetical protein I6K03_18515 [Chromobacterium violaceum]
MNTDTALELIEATKDMGKQLAHNDSALIRLVSILIGEVCTPEQRERIAEKFKQFEGYEKDEVMKAIASRITDPI